MRFESVHILQELYDQRMWNQRFLPVLVGGAGPEQVWEPLRPYHRYQADSDDGYEDLYRRLTDQPALVRPALGQRKVLPPKNVASRATTPAARPAGPVDLLWPHQWSTDSFEDRAFHPVRAAGGVKPASHPPPVHFAHPSTHICEGA